MAFLFSEKPKGTVEQVKPFIATPERVSQYLELKTEEVEAQMRSVEGRQQLFDDLMEHEDDIRESHSEFHPELLREQLDSAGEALAAQELYLEEVQSPEKKGFFNRAWDSVKGFTKRHPVVTGLLATAVVAGGVAAGFYFTGNWELLMTSTGLNKVIGAADAAGKLAPATAPTSLLPGGGLFEIPSPVSPPDLGSPI